MFDAWVSGGGNLIAMRPDKKLAGLLGITDAGTTLANAYLKVNTATQPGTGITGETIQFHGTADRYNLGGASAVAQLYSHLDLGDGEPGGDLAKRRDRTVARPPPLPTTSLARSCTRGRATRPGPVRSATGRTPVRSDDLFFGAAAGDSQPDWVDLDKVAIPQADEQQRLLGKLVEQMNQDRKPLPKFWYLPNGAKAAVFMSGDDHGNGGTGGALRRS